MKKTLHFIHFIKQVNKAFYLLLFLLSSTVGFAQTITPTKTVTVAPGVCGALDVELKIQGTNPVARPLEVVLVIDVSGSMGSGNNPKPLAYAQDAANDFIDKMFLAANNPTGNNKVAIVTFSSSGIIKQGLTNSTGKAGLKTIINGLVANGGTNIEDGILKANQVLNSATYDCSTARSVVLLTDGVANESATHGTNCSGGQLGTCIQDAIAAANAGKTVVKLGVTYNNQFFTVGLFGAISGTEQTNAQYTLNQIQSGGSFFTENAADLTGIYSQIFTQLSWVAKQIIGTPFEKETVDPNFIIGTVTATKGTTSVTGQQISWNIDFLNVETITLKYRLTPKPNTCGNQMVSTSRLDFQNALCVTTFQNITSPTTNVPCPIITLLSQTNVTCFGGNNGAITLNDPTGGQGPYTYKWTKNNVDFAITKNISGLSVGTYKVTATDSNNCATGILTIEIIQPAAALALAASSKTDASCYAASSGTVTAGVVTNSVGTVTYSWKNSLNVVVGTTASVTGLPAGTYTLTVTDSCSSQSNSVIIGQPAFPLTLAASSKTDASCYGASSGTVTAGAVTNFVGTVTYSWKNSLNVVVGTTASVTGLPAGTYTLTVTDSCSSQSNSVIIGQPTFPLTLAASSKTDASCYGASTGTVTAGLVTNSVGTVTYSWKNSLNVVVGTTASVTGLPAGTYTLTVTDSCSSQSNSVIVGQPSSPLALAASSKTDASCYSASSGTVTAGLVTNSVGTVTYSWKNSLNVVVGTTSTVTGLPAGTYTLTVTDSCSSQSNSVIIGQPSFPLALAASSKTDASCYGTSTGTVTAGVVTHSIGTVTYSWKNSLNVVVGTTASVSGLPAGTYTLTVTDSCSSQSNSVIVGQPSAPLSCSITQNKAVSSNGLSDGEATVSPLGGNGNYTYLWDNNETTQKAIALNAGLHSVTVSDSKGCTTTCTIIISEPNVLSCSVIQNAPAKCYGDHNGIATVTAIGGNGQYTYLWDNNETTAQAIALTAGLHTVTVTDKLGYKTTCTVTIGQPQAALTAAINTKTDVNCKGDATGSATASATGGNGTYSYSWNTNPVQTSATIINLIAGTYIVTVTDQKGCTDTEQITITEPALALTATKSQINASCGGASSGSATVVVSGGTIPYTYSWNTNPVQTSATANNLIAGNYTVIITDSKGCTISKSFDILDGDSVKPIINPLPQTSTINCPAEPVFAQATATDNNGTIASLTYVDSVTPGNCAGSYTKTRTWTAKDACGNISLPVSQTIIVQDITAPTWSTQIDSLNKTIECSNQQALASAQALFPTATDACDTNVTNIVKVSGQFVASQGCSNAGTYTNTWTVKDDCGNTSETFTQVITIEDTTIPTFDGELPADITVSCDAVPAPANLEASDNCSGNLPIIFTETKSGIQNQCNTNYTLTRTWTTSDCSGNKVTYIQIITVRDTTAPTGTAPSDVANLQSIADIPAGSPEDITDESDNCSDTVTITVSDSNNGASGCDGNVYILTRTYTLTDCAGNKTELVQTFTVDNKVSVSGIASNVTCLGGHDGSITVTSSPGSTVVIRNENNEIVGNTNLPAGTYTLTATSAVNNDNQICTATATVVITQPNYTTKISGQIINIDTNTPIANVPVTLVPQGTTQGPVLLRITGADGRYSFTGMVTGSYLVQVQDANLNSAYQLYPVTSSLFFTTIEDCKFQEHNFEYGKSNLPVLGDYVWYDTNGNGVQDEWYDANNDGVVTKNIPDGEGAIDYSQWEWIDLNGDNSYAGPQNVGELNAGGFGNAASANVIIDGPNGYHAEVIVGIEGFWRNRPDSENPYGDYTIKLVRDANLDAVATALGNTGLVKVIPSITDKRRTAKTGKSQMHTVCQTTTDAGYIVTVTPEDLVHLDADFGVNCKEYRDIVANDDSAGPFPGVNHTTPNVLNVLPNDTIEGVVVTAPDVIITTVTPNEFLQLNPDGSVDILPNAPAGTLTMVYQICEADQTSNCDTATVTVTIVAPVMTVTATSICINDVPYIDYVVTPVNFTPINGVTIAWADANNNVVTTMTDLPLSGRVLWPGAVVDQAGNGVDWPGWLFQNNQWVQGADGFEGLRPTANVTVSVNPSETITVNYPPSDPYCTARPTFAILANDDSAGPLPNNVGGTNVLNVYTNDTLNGNAVNPADVTLTTVTPDPTGALTLNPDGSVDVKVGTVGGVYTLTYQICENADFGNCDTAIVTVTVLTPVDAVNDVYNVGCNTFGLVGNALTNDFKGATRATLELVNFTLLSQTGNEPKTDPNITIDASGNVTVSSLTPSGTYTYNYQICDKLSTQNCDTATITITVAPVGVTQIASKACNDDRTPIDLRALLPVNTPATGTWVDTDESNALQGNILNPFGLALGNYKFEYKIADESCPRSILLTMEVNDDCKVLACENIVIHNAFSPNGDGINDVFTIDGIDQITCYPENNVEIYNRWGILVFETNNYNNITNAFDGTSRGRTTVKQSDGLPTGTYFYIVNYKSLDGNNAIQNNKKDGYLYLSK